MKLLIVGLGLIGGSMAKALAPTHTLYALDKNPDSLHKAKKFIANGYTALEQVDIQPDAVFVCVPVSTAVAMAPGLMQRFPGCLFIDCCSTKRSVQAAFSGARYVGMHPMAGSEGSGFDYARAELFRGAVICVTGAGEDAQIVTSLAETLGGRTVRLGAAEHDRATAMVSHLPHVLAAALCATAHRQAQSLPYIWELAAGGFSDLTRIADSDAVMWGSIFADNAQPILDDLASLQGELATWEQLLKEKDEQKLTAHFALCKQKKQAFKPGGGIFPKNGVQYHVQAEPAQYPELINKALQAGACEIKIADGEVVFVCANKEELARLINALHTEDK